MNKRDMLLGGPGLDGYAYCADVYCVPCGQRMIEALPREKYGELEARDSDTVPQPIFFGEADTAQHCGECGEYMYGQEPDPFACTDPAGHVFRCTGTQYGGDDPRWNGEGRSLCVHCGHDGDG
jgi:hypothetical protein